MISEKKTGWNAHWDDFYRIDKKYWSPIIDNKLFDDAYAKDF